MAVTDLKYLFKRPKVESDRDQQLSDEERQSLIGAVQQSWEGMTAADRNSALQAIHESYQRHDKKHPLNLPAPTATTQQPPTELGGVELPGSVSSVKGPAPKTWQEGVEGAIARTPSSGELQEGRAQAQQRRELERIEARNEGKTPTATTLKHQEYLDAVEAGYEGSEDQYHAEQAAKGRGAGAPPKKKTLPEQYEDAYRKQYGIPSDEILNLKDLGYLNELMAYDRNHGTQSIQTRMERQPDGTLLPVTVMNTTGAKGEPKPVRDGGAPTSEGGKGSQPPVKGKPAPGRARFKVGEPFGQTKGEAGLTPVQQKAKRDYVDAVALADLAKSVAAKPDDAINQKRLLVQLERASAGRFTVQALDYVKQAGWGNTLAEWAQKPTTGALPADILRQIVDGANQNLQSKKIAMDTANQLEGGSSSGDTSDDDFLKKIK